MSRGGADSALRRSLWRWPRICRSSVSTSAPQPAALARSISSPTKPRSRITYSWNQKGLLVAATTSSIEQMLIVDKVNGTPAASAACAARISPSACCMPHSPVGASASGIDTACPARVVASERPLMSTITFWRSLTLAKSSSLAR